METFNIKLDDVILDEDLWPRTKLDEERIQEFMDLYAEGVNTLPSIVVSDPYEDGVQRSLVDGWHRYEAARRAGITELPASEFLTETDADIFMEAVRLSAVSSLPMSRMEKQAAVDRILEDKSELSDREIARCAGVSHTFVAKRRSMALSGNVATQGSNEAFDRSSNASDPTPQQAAERLLKGMKQVVSGGLFLFNKDGNMAKVLSEAASRIYGDAAGERLAEIERWSSKARQICEHSAR